MHTYYVSYWWHDGTGYGYGSLIFETPGPVRTRNNLRMIEQQAAKPGHRIVILNIIRLDTL
jgi:hypothetical protein